MIKLKKWFLNFLIIGYLIVIYFSGVPETNTLNTRIKNNAQSVAFALGIWPSWSMFAPNPIRFDSKTYVNITYANGEVKEHDIEIPLSGILAPFRKARWMKYSQDNLRSPNQRGLLGPALRHLREKYQIEGNAIINMKITRKWLDVAPFNEHQLIPLRQEYARREGSQILIEEDYKDYVVN